MAVNKEDLLIAIQADTKDASKSIAQLSQQLGSLTLTMEQNTKAAKATEKSISGIGGMAVKLAAGYAVVTEAIRVTKQAMDLTVGEFLKAQDIVERLGNTLKGIGDKDVAGTTERFLKFAERMEKVSVVADDTTLTLLQLAKAAGQTNEQAELLATTAANIAASGKMDITSAFNALLMSLKGNTRGLAQLRPELGGMAKDAAQAGEAVRYMAETFGGFAAREGESTLGRAKQLQNAFNNLQEEVGGAIVKIFGIGKGTADLTEKIRELTQVLHDNAEGMEQIGSIVSFVASVLKDTLLVAINAVGAAVAVLRGSLNLFPSAFVHALALINPEFKAVAKEFQDFSGKLEDDAETFASRTGKYFKSLFGIKGSKPEEPIVSAFERIQDAQDKLQKQTNITVGGFNLMSEEARSSLEALQKKVEELNLTVSETGKGEAGKIRSEYLKAAAEVDSIIKKFPKVGEITSTGNKAKALLLQKETLALQELEIKNLKEISDKNETVQNSINEKTLLQRDLIEQQYQQQVKLNNQKREQLKLEGALTPKLEEYYKTQEDLLRKNADTASSKAPSKTFEGLTKAGEDIAKKMGGTLSEGMGGAISGMASAANTVLDAVDALLNMIPQLLDKAAGILDKITAFPKTILTSVQNLMRAMVDFIKSFVPNLLDALPSILDSIITTIFETLPEAFNQLLQRLPELFSRFLDRLPDLIERFAVGLITQMPRISIALIEGLIKGAPKISFEIAKALAIKLPEAIVKGIIRGFQEVFGMFGDLMQGKFPKLIDMNDVKKAGNELAKFGKKLTSDASRIFSVKDLGEEAAGILEVTTKIQTALSNGARSIFEQILDAWRKVYDTYIKPFIDGMLAAWRWVYDRVVSPLINGITSVWNAINNSVIQPFITGLRAVFTFGQSLLGAVADLFMGVFTFGQNALMGAVSFISGIFDNAVVGLRGVFTYFETIYGALYTHFLVPLRDLVSMLTSLRLPEFNWPALPKWEWPEIPKPSWVGGIIGGGGGDGWLSEGAAALDPSNWATGGIVGGRASTSGDSTLNDTILAMLSPGEAVIPRSAMNNPGVSAIIDAILEGKMPRKMAMGGMVDMPSLSSLGSGVSRALSQPSNTVLNQTFEIKISTTEPIDDAFFRNKIMPKVKDELRRTSLEGQFVLSGKGLR